MTTEALLLSLRSHHCGHCATLLPGCVGTLSCRQDLLGAVSAVLAKPAQSEEQEASMGGVGLLLAPVLGAGGDQEERQWEEVVALAKGWC